MKDWTKYRKDGLIRVKLSCRKNGLSFPPVALALSSFLSLPKADILEGELNDQRLWMDGEPCQAPPCFPTVDHKNELRKLNEGHAFGVISFDGLDYEEQQIFMDIACFFVDQSKSIAMEVWEASGWSSQHALETLKNKCLVQEMEEGFSEEGEERCALRMHDHLRDLGREMADGLSRPRRLWRPRDLEYLESMGFRNILAHTIDRCFHSFIDESMKSRITYLLGESDVRAETSPFLLWLELRYMDFQNQRQLNLDLSNLQPCIPSWIPLQKLQYLRIRNFRCTTLWQSPLQVPTQLKELRVYDTYGLKTVPGLSDLKKLIELNISNCEDLRELSVARLNCLERIVLYHCYILETISGISDLRNLVELSICQCPKLEQLCLRGVNSLNSITVEGPGNSLETVTIDGSKICWNTQAVNFSDRN